MTTSLQVVCVQSSWKIYCLLSDGSWGHVPVSLATINNSSKIKSLHTFVSYKILWQEFTGGSEGQHTISLDQQVTAYVNWCSGNHWLSHSRLYAWSTICQTIWFLLSQSSCIWRNADNEQSMVDGATLIRNKCEPVLKATCHLCRANEEVIFPYYKVKNYTFSMPSPNPRVAKTCDLLLTNHDLLVTHHSLQPT
jgi:hypothetical protein